MKPPGQILENKRFELADHGEDGFSGWLRTRHGKVAVIASWGDGWDHVSVSRRDRLPTYEDMQDVARAFFDEGEYAMQLHVPATEHVNDHPYCLHWWRPNDREMPVPPRYMV